MAITSTQLVFTARETVGYETRELGALGDTRVRVRTTSSGISHGTEMFAFLHRGEDGGKVFLPQRYYGPPTGETPPPFPFRWAGYEAVGVVEAVGAAVTTWAVGDRVWFASPHMTRFEFDVADARAQRLPAGMTDDQAILVHLTMVALNAVLDAQVKSGDAVLVMGGGTVGQLAARLALHDGASRVFLSEPLASRRAMAERVPGIVALDPTADLPVVQVLAANGGRSPDVVIECSGAIPALHQAIQAAGLGGTVIAAGMYGGPATGLNLSEEFLLNRVTIKASMGVWGCPSRFPGWDLGRLLRESVRLIAEGHVAVDGFVTGELPFADGQRAYEMVRDEPQRHMKIVLRYPAP